jgi:hypothetical protein
MTGITGLLVTLLVVGAALTGCAQDGRVQDQSEPIDSGIDEVALGDVPMVEVKAERPAGLMPEVEVVASRHGYAAAYSASPTGVFAN